MHSGLGHISWFVVLPKIPSTPSSTVVGVNLKHQGLGEAGGLGSGSVVCLGL